MWKVSKGWLVYVPRTSIFGFLLGDVILSAFQDVFLLKLG